MISKSEKSIKTSGRRAFFGRILAAIGAGTVAGTLLQRVLGSAPAPDGKDKPVHLSTHPMAVPRLKEGSKSNV